MAKIITTIAVENGMDIDEICSFETENFIGIWNHANDNFMLILKSDIEFHPFVVKNCDDLRELDYQVYEKCGEHIVEAYSTSTYNFEILSNENELNENRAVQTLDRRFEWFGAEPQEEFDWGEKEYTQQLEMALDRACDWLRRYDWVYNRSKEEWKQLVMEEQKNDKI